VLRSVHLGVLWDHAYRDKKVVGVFVRFFVRRFSVFYKWSISSLENKINFKKN
jgi:hypothetical protein